MEQGQKWHLASRLPYNVLRKSRTNAFAEGQEGYLVCRPKRRAIFCCARARPHSGNVSNAGGL